MALLPVFSCVSQVGLLPGTALATCRGAQVTASMSLEAQYERDLWLVKTLLAQLDAAHTAMAQQAHQREEWPSAEASAVGKEIASQRLNETAAAVAMLGAGQPVLTRFLKQKRSRKILVFTFTRGEDSANLFHTSLTPAKTKHCFCFDFVMSTNSDKAVIMDLPTSRLRRLWVYCSFIWDKHRQNLEKLGVVSYTPDSAWQRCYYSYLVAAEDLTSAAMDRHGHESGTYAARRARRARMQHAGCNLRHIHSCVRNMPDAVGALCSCT